MNEILEKIPEEAKDIRLTYKNIADNSSIKEDINLLTYALAVNLKNKDLIDSLKNLIAPEEIKAAHSAVALMNMTNIYYSYTEIVEDIRQMPPGLRMQSYATHGGIDKKRWERLTLIVSIVNKCKSCIKSHVEIMKKDGESLDVIKDIGRLAASVNAIHKFI